MSDPSKLIDYQQHVKNIKNSGGSVTLITNDVNCVNCYPPDTLDVHHVWINNFIVLNLYFSMIVIRLCLSNKNDTISVLYSYRLGAAIFSLPIVVLRWLFNLKITLVYDLRSGSLNHKYFKIINFVFVVESLLFDKVFVVSEGLKKWLFKNRNNVHVIGVGTSHVQLGVDDKYLFSFPSEVRYVIAYSGTFALRNMWSFFENQSLHNSVAYVFVGDGDEFFKEKMESKFRENNLSSHLLFTGRLPYNNAMSVISQADVCVSLVPDTEYYAHQPPTKIYDYISLGKPVITNNHVMSIDILNELEWSYIVCTGGKLFEDLYDIEFLIGDMSSNGNNKGAIKSYYWVELTKKLLVALEK